MIEDDKLKNVRQPLVTATGIILGFTLNIACQLATKSIFHRQNYRSPYGVKPLHTYPFVHCGAFPYPECKLSKR